MASDFLIIPPSPPPQQPHPLPRPKHHHSQAPGCRPQVVLKPSACLGQNPDPRSRQPGSRARTRTQTLLRSSTGGGTSATSTSTRRARGKNLTLRKTTPAISVGIRGAMLFSTHKKERRRRALVGGIVGLLVMSAPSDYSARLLGR